MMVSYLLLVFFVILNMVLAVVLKSYEEVRRCAPVRNSLTSTGVRGTSAAGGNASSGTHAHRSAHIARQNLTSCSVEKRRFNRRRCPRPQPSR